MVDQATQLRKLVLLAMRERPLVSGPSPRMIVVNGGQHQVGTTTIAVNLSIAMAEHGFRVVLVDSDPIHSDVAGRCGLPELRSSTAFADEHRDIHQLLQPGPAGIQILPKLRMPELHAPGERERSTGELSYERLLRQLATLSRHTDIVVFDFGGTGGEAFRRFANMADDVLLVCTPVDEVVMSSYSRIKSDLMPAAGGSLRLLVNRTINAHQAAGIHHRINSSCHRFLNTTVVFGGHVPIDEAVPLSATRGTPVILGEPVAAASRAIGNVAMTLISTQTPTQASSSAA